MNRDELSEFFMDNFLLPLKKRQINAADLTDMMLQWTCSIAQTFYEGSSTWDKFVEEGFKFWIEQGKQHEKLERTTRRSSSGRSTTTTDNESV